MFYLVKTFDDKLKILGVCPNNVPFAHGSTALEIKDSINCSSYDICVKIDTLIQSGAIQPYIETTEASKFIKPKFKTGIIEETISWGNNHREDTYIIDTKILLNYFLLDPFNEEDVAYLSTINEPNYSISESIREQILPGSVVLIEKLDKKYLNISLNILHYYKNHSIQDQEDIFYHYRPLDFLGTGSIFNYETTFGEEFEHIFLTKGFYPNWVEKMRCSVWMAFDILFHVLGLSPLIYFLEKEGRALVSFDPFSKILHNKLTTPYEVTYLSFWAIAINLPIRLIGIILGFVISLITTLLIIYPTYLIAKTYYNIQESKFVKNVEAKYGSVEPLLTYWFDLNRYTDEKSLQKVSDIFARNINTYDYIHSLLSYINRFKPYRKEYSWWFEEYFARFEKKNQFFLSQRKEFIENEIIKSLVVTICLAILFLPTLIFTYSWIKNKKKDYERELTLLAELIDLPSIYSTSDIYPTAEKLMVKRQASYACMFFSHVRPDNPHYANAMNECAHYERAAGNYHSAKFFAKQANDQILLDSIERIAQELPISSETSSSLINKIEV